MMVPTYVLDGIHHRGQLVVLILSSASSLHSVKAGQNVQSLYRVAFGGFQV